MKNYKLKLFSIILVFFLSLLFFNVKNTYGIYRETLNTKVYLTVLDPSSQTRTITFNSHGGSNIDPIGKPLNSTVGILPTPTRENYNFAGWYTEETGGTKIEPDTILAADVTYHAHWIKVVCVKATTGTLHTETCNKDTSFNNNTPGCRDAGYAQGGTITYGTIPDDKTPLSGYAYNCDVNNDDIYDPITERFYYLREVGDNAALVHYTSFDENGQMDSSMDRHIYTYEAGKEYLPTSTLWTNSELNSFDGKVARYVNRDDIESACGTYEAGTGYLDTCQFLVENTRFQSNSLGISNIWIENSQNTSYLINTTTRDIEAISDNTTESAVRPVIEIPLETLDGYHERPQYTVTFNSQGGSSVEHIVRYENEMVGTLEKPTKEGFTFGGWYTDTSYTTLVEETTLITENVIYYAKWVAITDKLQYVFYIPGTCVFKGKNASIISPSNDCISTVNPTGSNIDYTETDNKYIDTQVSLYSEENYDKDYEIGFTIVEYDYSANEKQATLASAKLENSTLKYPGLVFRQTTTNGVFEIAQTIKGVKQTKTHSFTNPITNANSIDVIIKREDGVVSYSFNGSEMILLQDTTEYQKDYFNFHTWFGATGTSTTAQSTTSAAQRIINGTLSNMYVKLESDNVITYTVTFNSHSGTSSFSSKEVKFGDSVGTLPVASKPGYYFDGWYTEAVGGRKIDESEVIVGNVTYHARYRELFLVTFIAGDGELSISPNTIEVAEGLPIGELPNATLSGYVLDGWFTSSSGGTKITEETTVNKDETYYAQYVIGYTVTFDSNGGIPEFVTKIVGSGHTVGTFPTVERSGYSLVGWYTDNTFTTLVDPDETIITGDTTFIANWLLSNTVAMIGNDEYESLQDAIDAVQDNNQTIIKLVKDIEESVTIPFGKNIVFDLQDYSITSTSGITITNTGTIEIKNGTIDCTANAITIENKGRGVINITGGTINGSKSNTIKSYGKVIMTGGTVTGSAPNSGVFDVEAGGYLEMSGGEIKGTGHRQALYNNGGTIIISGTSYLSNTGADRAAVHNYLGTMTITGGTIISVNQTAVLNGDRENNASTATLTIGVDDTNMDITTPVIQGKLYGLQANSGLHVTVYDGFFKGVEGAINDETLIDHDENLDFVHGTEAINADTYDTAYLDETT